MFCELDELLKLTKLVEATKSNASTTEKEEDIPGTVVYYDDKDYSGRATFLSTNDGSEEDNGESEDDSENEVDGVPQPPKDGKSYGSAGNPTFHDKKGNSIDNGPLFEEPQENAEAPIADSTSGGDAIDELNKGTDELKNAVEQEANGAQADNEASFGRCLKNSLSKFKSFEAIERGMGREFVRKYQFESSAPAMNICRTNPFELGQVVQPNSIPMLFIVKKNDGNTITAAKPTSCPEDCAVCQDGEWPEFTFDSDELMGSKKASLGDIDDIIAYNDRVTNQPRGFDGRPEDDSPMKIAQEFAREQTIDDIVDNMDEIFGQYKQAAFGGDDSYCYAAKTPAVVYRTPKGTLTTQAMTGGYKIKYGD